MIGIGLSWPRPLWIQPMLTRQRLLSNIGQFGKIFLAPAGRKKAAMSVVLLHPKSARLGSKGQQRVVRGFAYGRLT